MHKIIIFGGKCFIRDTSRKKKVFNAYLSGKNSGEVRRLGQLVLKPDQKSDIVRRQRFKDRVKVLGARHICELVLLCPLRLRKVPRVEPAIEAKA